MIFFVRDHKDYPQLHLGVADFVGVGWQECAAPYEGASNLANFLLWSAADSPHIQLTELKKAIRSRKLWLQGTFRKAAGLVDTFVELQVGPNSVNLTAGEPQELLNVKWRQLTKRLLVDSVLYEYGDLFDTPAEEERAPLKHKSYMGRITNQEFAANPALQVGASFNRLERELRDNAMHMGPDNISRIHFEQVDFAQLNEQ